VTELPPELLESLEKKESQLKHNWMYSFMPATIDGFSTIYLVAYCKICDTGVSSKMFINRLTYGSITTNMDIPKWGCIPIE
jgi:hypothetical protein